MKYSNPFLLVRPVCLRVLTQAASWPRRLEALPAIRIIRLSRAGPSTAARVALVLLQLAWLTFAQDDRAFILRLLQRALSGLGRLSLQHPCICGCRITSPPSTCGRVYCRDLLGVGVDGEKSHLKNCEVGTLPSRRSFTAEENFVREFRGREAGPNYQILPN